MKKTYYVPDKWLISDWDFICFNFFNKFEDEYIDLVLDNIIDIITF